MEVSGCGQLCANQAQKKQANSFQLSPVALNIPCVHHLTQQYTLRPVFTFLLPPVCRDHPVGAWAWHLGVAKQAAGPGRVQAQAEWVQPGKELVHACMGLMLALTMRQENPDIKYGRNVDKE